MCYGERERERERAYGRKKIETSETAMVCGTTKPPH